MTLSHMKKTITLVPVLALSSATMLAQDLLDTEKFREQFDLVVGEMNSDDMEELHAEMLERMRESMEERRSHLSVTQGSAVNENDAALGIRTMKARPAELKGLGMRRGVGLRLQKVQPDGPAAKAGLSSGDIIESVQGQWIFNKQQLEALIRSFQPGEKIRIRGVRNGKPFEREATLMRGKDIPGYKQFMSDSDSRSVFKFESVSDSDSDSDSDSSSSSDRDSSSSSSSGSQGRP